MKFVLICTEGNVSEPEYIKALDSTLKGQRPQHGDELVEIVPIPLGGNQGYVKLIEKAELHISIRRNDSDHLLSCATDEDQIEKWLICDYDELEKSGLNLNELREQAKAAGYELVMNKPNFEFFILVLLIGHEPASIVKRRNYTKAINAAILKLNKLNMETRGFSDSMLLPKYSKKKYSSEHFFGRLLDTNPDLLIAFVKSAHVELDGNYTEMAKIIAALMRIYSYDLA